MIQLFLDYFRPWHTILNMQLCNSEIRRTNMVSGYFIDFTILDHDVPRMPILQVVPLQIILGKVDVPASETLGCLNGHIVTKATQFFVPDRDAMGVQMHFNSGYIRELEVYSLEGRELRFEGLEKMNITYVVND